MDELVTCDGSYRPVARRRESSKRRQPRSAASYVELRSRQNSALFLRVTETALHLSVVVRALRMWLLKTLG